MFRPDKIVIRRSVERHYSSQSTDRPLILTLSLYCSFVSTAEYARGCVYKTRQSLHWLKMFYKFPQASTIRIPLKFHLQSRHLRNTIYITQTCCIYCDVVRRSFAFITNCTQTYCKANGNDNITL
jgi:hypothetical protein